MDTELIRKIDELIDAGRESLARDVIKLVNIRSVREAPLPGAPFGAGVRRVLDTVLEMGAERGFAVRDYENAAVVSAAYNEGDIDLGIWAHGDVVHEGSGWIYEPFNAIEYKGVIIGRGATDNKGQLAAILHLLQIFKKLDIKLRYNPALYVGSDEETAMGDMFGVAGNPDAQGFLNLYSCPRLSLVPDSGFPVGYGGKGSMRVRFRAKTPWNKLHFTAGTAQAPGFACAQLAAGSCPDIENCTVERGESTYITAETPPVHPAHPKPGGNMVTLVLGGLLEHDLLDGEDKAKAELLKAVSLDVTGEMFGINCGGGAVGDLTLAMLDTIEVDGKPEFGINIRYPVETTFENILEQLKKVAEVNHFEVVDTYCGVRPYLLDPNWEVIQKLTEISNEQCAADAQPYTLSGATYAHCLPHGLAFGMSGYNPPEDFPKGHGGAHGKDECVSLDRLQRAMRIYARTLLALNEMDW